VVCAFAALDVFGANVISPGDPIVAVAAAAGSNNSSTTTNSPAGQTADKLIDGNTATKYLNLQKTGAGVIVYPLHQWPATTVGSFKIATGEDAPERDPVTITIEGTNDRYATSTLNSHWTLLYSGPSGLSTDPGRSTFGPEVAIGNSTAYKTYRVLVTAVRDESTANSFQMSELQLIGSTAATTAFVVNTTTDAIDTNPGDGICSNGAGLCGISGAIQEANAHAGPDTIAFAVSEVVLASTQTITSTSDVTFDGPGANIVTLNAHEDFGAFVIAAGATVRMSGLTIANAFAANGVNDGAPGQNGGAIRNAGTLHLDAMAFTNDVAGQGQDNNISGVQNRGGDGGKGGAIFNSGTLTVTNSTFNGNRAGKGGWGTLGNGGGGTGGFGGAIANAATMTITNCTITQNAAGDGGNLNQVGGSGGGIYNLASGTLTIRNSTIISNSVGTSLSGRLGQGGDIDNDGDATLASTITNDIAGDAPFKSAGYTLVQANVTLDETANTGTNITGVDPKVSPLADNGGPTKTCALMVDSPALDKGKNFATDDQGNPITSDQRGAARVDSPNFANASGGDGTDIGAFEMPVLILTVNSLGDNDDVCDAADCTLREAINAATATFNSINITVSGTINLSGVLPDITHNTGINGPGAGSLTVRRDTGGRYRVFTIGAGTSVSMSGLTVSDGFPADGTVFLQTEIGGGIKNSGTLSLSDVIVSGNHAGNASGGSNGGPGGGIYSAGTLTLTNCTVSNNTAGSASDVAGPDYGRGGSGGGIYSNGTLTVVGTTVSGNTAGTAGYGYFSVGDAGGNGGGIDAIGTFTITNSTLSGNAAGHGGGGDYGGGVGGQGGGLSAEDASGTITSTTITGNQSGTGGVNGAGPAAANGHGGGVGRSGTGTVTIRNSIVAGNAVAAPAAGDTPDVYGAPTSGGYNLVGVQSGEFIQTGDQAGTLAAPLNAMLGALASNGGPTQTHKLLAGSPAIDSGANFGLSTDQRGHVRPRDFATANATDGSDIGAYEFDDPPSVVSIVRAGTNPAAANTVVSYTVSFSSIVSGVDTADFALTVTSGSLSGKSIATVTGGGTTYTVTVNTGTGNGTLRLDLIDNDSISGVTGPLGGVGAGNGTFTSGEAYTIVGTGDFVVTKTADTDDGTCNADCSLREAVAAANAAPGAQTITFAIPAADPGCVAGVCTIDLLTASTSDPDSASALYLTDNVTILGSSAAGLVVERGAAAPDFRIFIVNPGVTASFTNLTFRNGRATTGGDGLGGGAVAVLGSATVSNCVMGGNHSFSSFGGGAVHLQSGVLTVVDSIVSDNVADNGGGGGIVSFSSTATLIRTNLSRNVAANGRGGAVVAPTGTLVVTGCTVDANHTTAIAGLSVGGGIFAANLTMTDSTVSNNYTGDGIGGGTGGVGGGVSMSNGTITNSTISGNHTGRGADVPSGTGGKGGDGGGIFVGVTATFTACTVTGNSTGHGGNGLTNGASGNGGGIATNNAVTIRDSIVAGNTVGGAPVPGTGPDVSRTTTAFTSGGYNVIGATNGDFNDPTDQSGTAATPLDAQLAPLADNGGLTLTHKLLPTSPALDKGSSFGLAHDQRGVPRVSGVASDTGAFELQVFPAPVNLVANATGAAQITVSWGHPGGANHYEVTRSGTTIATPAANNYVDSVAANSAHVYRARAIGASGEMSEYSNIDLATAILFTDDPVAAGTTPIRKAHLTELRTAVNAVRAAAGLAPVTFTDADPTGVTIKPAHITELRNALAPARAMLALGAQSYTWAATSGTLIHADDVKELRDGVK